MQTQGGHTVKQDAWSCQSRLQDSQGNPETLKITLVQGWCPQIVKQEAWTLHQRLIVCRRGSACHSRPCTRAQVVSLPSEIRDHSPIS